MSEPALDAAFAAGDIDELVRWVDRLVEAGDWRGLVALGARARTGYERTGHQLWPIASQVEYRLALEAPAVWAAPALEEGAGRFALGPLPEVAASTHTWVELAPHLVPGPVAGLVAHERVVRGEGVSGEAVAEAGRLGADVLELPLVLQPWEPAYCLAAYRPDGADIAAPAVPALGTRRLPGRGPATDYRDAVGALAALVERWVVESNGVSEVVAVAGTAEAAIAALGPTEVRAAEVEPAVALATMAWAGASGGAHGRRRGAAVGRFGTWWALAALAGLVEEWPGSPAELGDAANELRWLLWAPEAGTTGWSLHLAVEDPEENLAWAIAATDHV